MTQLNLSWDESLYEVVVIYLPTVRNPGVRAEGRTDYHIQVVSTQPVCSGAVGTHADPQTALDMAIEKVYKQTLARPTQTRYNEPVVLDLGFLADL